MDEGEIKLLQMYSDINLVIVYIVIMWNKLANSYTLDNDNVSINNILQY